MCLPSSREKDSLVDGNSADLFQMTVLGSDAPCSSSAYFSHLTTKEALMARKHTKQVMLVITLPCTTIKYPVPVRGPVQEMSRK